ncbi:MAG: hypothetical protein HYS58_01720 [Elusimicrobia bacterium]|nr:hypothetical protein [Elusimicrobiota bacterium]MBI4217528.1 hypothetical protein [Elusimicrobiota bacterium]
MRKTEIQVQVTHRAHTTPEEIQSCYLDYGHEWVFHKNIFYRDFGSSKYEIVSPSELKIGVTLVLFKAFKMRFDQEVRIHHGASIHSRAVNEWGYGVQCAWEFKELGNSVTEVQTTYRVEVPWFLGWCQMPLAWLWTYIRNKSWESDRTMLERRQELIALGFGDRGVYPTGRQWTSAKPSALPVGI